MKKTDYKNYLLVISASVLFGIFPSIQNFVLLQGVTPIALVVACNGISSLLALFFCLIFKISLKITKRQLINLILIGTLGLFFTDYLLDIAYTMIPVGYVTMVHFIFPSIVCFVMALFFKNKINIYKIFAIIASICGLAMLTNGGFSGNPLGLLIAFLSAIAYAYYIIATDKSCISTLHPMVMVFYTNLFTSAVALAIAKASRAIYPSSIIEWLYCLIVGAMLCIAIMLLNQGIIELGASTASFINMIEPVTSLVVSFIVYKYTLTALTLSGCALILLSLAFIAKSDRLQNQQKE